MILGAPLTTQPNSLTNRKSDELPTQKKRTDLVAQIQQELRALLTAEQRVQLARNQRGQGNERRIAPTHPNVKYGPHERNVMDVWLAKSDQPTPMLVSNSWRWISWRQQECGAGIAEGVSRLSDFCRRHYLSSLGRGDCPCSIP